MKKILIAAVAVLGLSNIAVAAEEAKAAPEAKMAKCVGVKSCEGVAHCTPAVEHDAANPDGWVSMSAADCTSKGGKAAE